MTCTVTTQYRIQCLLVCEADILWQGMVGGWEVIEASHTVSSGLNVTCHMLTLKINVFKNMQSNLYL